MRIPLWLHREWAIFLCANGAHVHCPHVSDSPYFNLRPTRRQARKATKMIDTQPCITEGEHIRSQRHLPASCPMSDQTVPRSLTGPDADDATGDASVRYLLVELPLMPAGYPRLDPEDATERITRGLDTFLRTQPHPSLPLAEPATIEQVYPGNVVSPEDTTEHEQLRGLYAAARVLADSPDANGDDIAEAWQDVLRVALTRWPGIA